MTISDAAHIHGIPERTIRRWIAEGRIRASKIGGVTHVGPARMEALAAAWMPGTRRARPRFLLT